MFESSSLKAGTCSSGVDVCGVTVDVKLTSMIVVPFAFDECDKEELSSPRLSFSSAGLIFRRILLMLLPGINI